MVINGDYIIDIVVDGEKGNTFLGNDVDISNSFDGDYGNEIEAGITLDIINTLNGEYGVYQEVVRGDIYEGATEVIPRAYDDVILQTRNKVVTENITVFKVPTYETHNPTGITFYIAQEGV